MRGCFFIRLRSYAFRFPTCHTLLESSVSICMLLLKCPRTTASKVVASDATFIEECANECGPGEMEFRTGS